MKRWIPLAIALAALAFSVVAAIGRQSTPKETCPVGGR